MAKLNSEGSVVVWATVRNERTDRIHILDRTHTKVVMWLELIADDVTVPLFQRHSFWHGITPDLAKEIMACHYYVIIGHTIWERQSRIGHRRCIVNLRRPPSEDCDEHLIWPPAFEPPNYEEGETRAFRSTQNYVDACDIAASERTVKIVELAWADSTEIRLKPVQLR